MDKTAKSLIIEKQVKVLEALQERTIVVEEKIAIATGIATILNSLNDMPKDAPVSVKI